MFDIHSEEALKQYAIETDEVAENYLEACKLFSGAKLILDKELVKGYKDKSIPKGASYEKALIMLIEKDDAIEEAYDDYIKSQQLMSGLKRVLESRRGNITLAQSLMKNRPQE